MTRGSIGAPPVEAGEERVVAIEDLAFGGQGVARVAGYVLFVEGALPGETVRVRVRRLRRGYADAALVALETASPERVSPPCRHYARCGGCDLQHLDPAAAAAAKRRQIEELVRRVAGIEARVLEPVRAGSPLRYRFRVDFTWTADRAGRPALGLHRAGRADEIVPIEDCLLAPEPVERARAVLVRAAGRARLDAWDPRRRRGFLRRASFQAAPVTGEILVVLETGRGDPPGLRALTEDLVRGAPRVVGVVRRDIDRQDRSVGVSILHGRDHLFEQVDGDRFRIPAGAFFQPNAAGWKALRDTVLRQLDPRAEETMLELYAGTGFFTVALARRCRAVEAVEGARESAEAARDNARNAGLDNVRAIHGDAASVLERGLPAEPPFAGVLVDPPRTGLGDAVARGLARARVGRIVYVSCDPATLARDLKTLTAEKVFRLDSIVPLDLFPQTHHVECVARLVRVPESDP